MRFKAKIVIVFLSTLVTLYAIIGGFLSKTTEAVARGSQYAQYSIFDEVLSHIIHDYVDEPDMEKVRIGSLRGLADGLDPYSAYLTAQQVKQYDPRPSTGDTGMIISKVGGYAYVVAVLKGSPADQSGIREGDFIEYVGKIPSRDLSLYDVQQLLRGAPGASVAVRIVHQGQSRKISFNLAKIAQPSIESRIEETGIGYIKIPSLVEGRAVEVKRQISDLTAKGAQKIILDLRDCASGKLQDGVDVANLFVSSGVLAEVVGKEGQEAQSFNAEPGKVAFTGPLSVLIDRGTAGPAEVIAAAVRDSKRGELVGERSFGAGSEQRLFPLSDGGALLITVAKYAPASGKPFMDQPIDPTVKVERPVETQAVVPDNDDDDDDRGEAPQANQPKPEPTPAAPTEDVQLKKALELLRQVPAKAQAAQKHLDLHTPGRRVGADAYERKHAA
jgi:carboxyl-terminal processing protease